MKKFLKKRPVETAPVIPAGHYRSHSASSSVLEASSELAALRHQVDFMVMENSKMKTAIQGLTEENLRLQDRLRNGRPRPGDECEEGKDEIQKLVQVITEENDNLLKQLQMERECTRETRRVLEDEIRRLSTDQERYQLENTRLQQDLQMAVVENDDLRLRASSIAHQRNDAAYEEDIGARSSFEACRTLLVQLKEKYKDELNRLQQLLDESLNEKRTLGLRLAQMASEATIAKKRGTELWESARSLEEENRKLTSLLESKDERMDKMETMFSELVNVSREITHSKTKGEKEWNENRRDMVNKLHKLERKCRNLKEDNEKLRNFKQEAVSKLIEARHLLLLDS